ncbi:hypothetical protein, partial [Klebsiella variicola]|uniref:hypothetical protein n=1 Tax=Klebsiella variicola TaxID=244366 RepID=UPI001BD64B26
VIWLPSDSFERNNGGREFILFYLEPVARGSLFSFLPPEVKAIFRNRYKLSIVTRRRLSPYNGL